MTIKEIQERVGTKADGLWGPRSKQACIGHLTSLMPAINPWPTADNLKSFYGMPGDEAKQDRIAFPFNVYYEGQLVRTTIIHHKCADSFIRVLQTIKELHGDDEDVMAAISDYSGCFMNRPKRNGSGSKSVHAYAAAVDFSANKNTFRDTWPTKASMPIQIMECFAREGWASAGGFWGYDAMHFEAVRRK